MKVKPTGGRVNVRTWNLSSAYSPSWAALHANIEMALDKIPREFNDCVHAAATEALQLACEDGPVVRFAYPDCAIELELPMDKYEGSGKAPAFKFSIEDVIRDALEAHEENVESLRACIVKTLERCLHVARTTTVEGPTL